MKQSSSWCNIVNKVVCIIEWSDVVVVSWCLHCVSIVLDIILLLLSLS